MCNMSLPLKMKITTRKFAPLPRYAAPGEAIDVLVVDLDADGKAVDQRREKRAAVDLAVGEIVYGWGVITAIDQVAGEAVAA